MPWRECSVMDERMQFVARRLSRSLFSSNPCNSPFTTARSIRDAPRTKLLPEPPQAEIQRLAEIERQYRLSEREYADRSLALAHYAASHLDLRVAAYNGNPALLVGALTLDPIRQRLESDVAHALAHRNELLRRRSELRMAGGQRCQK